MIFDWLLQSVQTGREDGARFMKGKVNKIDVHYIPNVIYSQKEGIDLTLQILQPSKADKPNKVYPCIVYVQGSAWMEQDLYGKLPELSKLAFRGYVIALVQYRHSGQAHFPAPIQDAKDAYRYLKKHASIYKIDPDQMVFMGDSSGGHTAVLAGMTSYSDQLDEDPTGCDPKAIIDLYGCVDPTMPDGFPSTPDHQQITSPEGKEMGFDLKDEPERAKKAVAKTYVANRFPPMLIVHGTFDHTVAPKQSIELYNALRNENRSVEMIFLEGAEHGGIAFWSKKMVKIYDRFLKNCLKHFHQ